MKTIKESASAAKAASAEVAHLSTDVKNAALQTMAEALVEDKEKIIAANARDMKAAKERGTSDALLDRLALNEKRIADMAEGIRQIAALPDPVGEIIDSWVTADGLRIKKVRVPMGVIGIIYEARPNVTADAAALAFKAGSSILLRGSASAYESNAAIVSSLRRALTSHGICPDAVCLVEDNNREAVSEMLRMREYIDVIIPRGGASLIKNAVENSTVPVIETGVGNCHVYVDESADYDMAENIVVNAKTQRPGVCNAAETLLVHKKWAEKYLGRLLSKLVSLGVELHGDEISRSFCDAVIPATDDDWAEEYLSLKMAVRVVDDVREAVAHINKYGTKHTECIVTSSPESEVAKYFKETVDAAAVNVNASTRFTDGFMYGFGAEIGISTQKLHARGPMGLREITSYKYIVEGDGQIRK